MVWNHTWMKFDRQGGVSPKKDCWCWLIFQHPEWKSCLCSESSDDWKFHGMYWFVVGRVLWLVMRVVVGALMKASLQTGLKCTNLHSPSSLPIKMQTRASLYINCLNFQSSVTCLWRWLPLKMLKCWSPPTVLFRTHFTHMIKFHASTFAIYSVFNVCQNGIFCLDSWHL